MRILDDSKAASADDNQEDEWNQVENTLFNEADKVLANLDSNTDPNEKLALIAKLMNMREKMHQQVFHGILYKKLITWKDLRIDPPEHADQAVVDTLRSFQTLEEDMGYLPTQHIYDPVTFETHAYFSFDYLNDVSGSTAMLESMVKHYNELERLINKNFIITPE